MLAFYEAKNLSNVPITGTGDLQRLAGALGPVFRQDRSASASPSRPCSRVSRSRCRSTFYLDPALADGQRS